jgi:hypothetical protein
LRTPVTTITLPSKSGMSLSGLNAGPQKPNILLCLRKTVWEWGRS